MQQLLGRKSGVVDAGGADFEHSGFVAKIAALECETKAYVASVGEDGFVNVWCLSTDGCFKPILELKSESTQSDSCFSAVAITKGERLVTGSVDGMVQVWSLRRSRFVSLIARHSATVTALATDELRPLSRTMDCMISVVVSGSTDGSLYVSDLETLEFARLFEGHTEEVTALCILPRQRRIVSASFDGFATIWSIDGDDRVSLNGHKERVTQLCALDRGKRVASSCFSGHVYIWCSTTGACLWSKEVGFEFVSGMALQRYAIASYRGVSSLNSGGSQMNLCPYFCVRGDDLDELAIVSAIDCEGVMANCIFDAPVTALGEVWALDAKGKHTAIVLAGLQTGQLLSVELVTTFASKPRPNYRLD
jgi:WD40 repeat protein